MRHYNIPIFIPHLGCPYNCIFCNQNKITSKKQPVDILEIRDIIDSYLDTLPAASALVEVAFFGGNFTALEKDLQEKYLQAVNPYIKKGKIDGIRVSTRPDCIDPDGLDLLKRWGVDTIELGVQSLDNSVLRASGRAYRVEDVEKSCLLIRQKKINLGIQLMVGLPGDSYESDIYSAKKAIANKPDIIRIYPTIILNGTQLEEMYKKGDYSPLKLDEAIKICSHMLLQFQKNGIKVIRIGLQPSDELLKPGAVIDGPFHPSFGELVEQEIFKHQAEVIIEDFLIRCKKSNGIILFVNEKDVSKMIGQNRDNIKALQSRFGCQTIRVKIQDGIPRDAVGIGNNKLKGAELLMSRSDYIKVLSSKITVRLFCP